MPAGAETTFRVMGNCLTALLTHPDALDQVRRVRRHDVRAGALILRASLGYLPVGVHLAVIDPGGGTARRAVALRAADGRVFVGPDNGLLMPGADVAASTTAASQSGSTTTSSSVSTTQEPSATASARLWARAAPGTGSCR